MFVNSFPKVQVLDDINRNAFSIKIVVLTDESFRLSLYVNENASDAFSI